jgi:hypothetical protein
MNRNQLLFLLLTPVIVAAEAAAGAGESVRSFLDDWKERFRELGKTNGNDAS